MERVQPLLAEQLCKRCNTDDLVFDTTAELEPLDEVLGQARAMRAIEFGIGIRRKGYHLFAYGPPGTGKHSIIKKILEKKAADEQAPPDWCYVNNFEQPHKPKAVKMPPGRASQFARDMDKLLEELKVGIPSAFESDDYRNRKHMIENVIKERQEAVFGEIQKRAKEKHITPIRTPAGMALAPTKDGEVIKPEDFEKLPEEEKSRIQEDINTLQKSLQEALSLAPKWESEQREKIQKLNREVTSFAVGHLLSELRQRYTGLEAVITHLDDVEKEIIEHYEEFLLRDPKENKEGEGAFRAMTSALTATPLRRYRVNVIVDNSQVKTAPIVYEDQPSVQNIMGRIEHLAQFGTLMTDFMLVRSGAFHRANGGYLILDARKLLLSPFAWEELKRTLQSQEIRIESLGQMLSMVSTVSLEPQPIDLNVKVVLVGDRMLYYLLSAQDPDFEELFKVPVDFDDRIARTPRTDMLFARLIASMASKEGLRPFDRGAVARIIEQGARLAEDSEKLSTQMSNLLDLLREADYWSIENGNPVIKAEDVERAVEARIHRSDRWRERTMEEIQRNTILIDTEGEQIGQINGLSVIQIGRFAFGRPNRITARIRLGKGEVLDIEREVDLGGPTHSKGVLILASFLGARYCQDRPLSLSASLVFEQSYSGVDGDSASSTELYALLSSIAEVPIKQSLAVTGSVNQYGKVQAIGGVNQKIEGFFDACRIKGLTGSQGVLIPASNIKHLMLRKDVVQAAESGQFHIYPIEHIDQGIEILTGLPAGRRDANGIFPKGSINRLVEDRLIKLAGQARNFGKSKSQGEKE